MARLADFEGELAGLLTRLLASGGTGNFLVVSVGPVYVQFAASPSDRRIHFEAVSNQYLPPDRQLGAMAQRRLEKAGFELRYNYERSLPAGTTDDLVAASHEAVALLRGVYGCAPDDGVDVQLQLEDIEHPENESLVVAIEAARRDPTEETGADMFGELLRATLLVPVDADGEPIGSVDDDGALTALVFTDYPSLLASKTGGGYIPMAGASLFGWVLDEGLSSLMVSSGTEPVLKLPRTQLEGLAGAARSA